MNRYKGSWSWRHQAKIGIRGTGARQAIGCEADISGGSVLTYSLHLRILYISIYIYIYISCVGVMQEGMKPPVIIFLQSKERAQELFNELAYDGVNVDVIHADRTQLQRDNIIKRFRLGEIWVLIATDLLARGLDFKVRGSFMLWGFIRKV
jgi:hypothetical protein